MRNIILLVVLLFSNIVRVHARSIDTVSVLGYFVVQYSKGEVESRERNKLLKKNRKPYSELIDMEKKTMFIPFADTAKASLLSAINNYSFFRKRTTYFLPQENLGKIIISRFCDKENDLTKEASYFKDDKFYFSKFNPKDVFCIYWVEAKAIKISAENTLQNRRDFLLESDAVASDAEFDVKLVYHYTLVANDFLYLENFEGWQYQ